MSSLGIFDKETKTYKKVADLSKPAVIDSEMSDSSTNAVQNKVVKSYVDGKFKQKLLAQMDGDGITGYCQLCTIKIYEQWISSPIEITVQERIRSTLDRLTVLFQHEGNIDPSIASFKVFGECDDWYISKIAASTWVIYGAKAGLTANISVVDYIGIYGANVTWDVTGVTALPDSKTKAVWGGNVSHAVSSDSASSASTVNGHTVNSDVPSGAKFTDTTYNDATTSAHGLMTPAMVSKLNGIAEGANRTTVDTSMSSTSTNPVQNKVIKSYVDGTQTGYYVGSNPPENTNLLWIDSLRGGMVKYFASETSKWHPVRAKGYDTPVDLINEGYWSYSIGPGITIDNISAIYDINKYEVTITIKNLSITSEAFTGPNNMVDINMPMYNLGHTGTIKPITVRPVSGEAIDMQMALNYPYGRIQTGPPYGIYKPATMQTIIFKVSHIH